MWQLINNFINNKLNNEIENNYFKDLYNIENYIGYIVEGSIEKNLNSINYDFDDISDTENYKILINLESMLKKYLYENQKILNFNTGILSNFNKDLKNNFYNKESINDNLIKCWINEAILYFTNNNNYINIELIKKILDFFRELKIIFNNISSHDNKLINNFIYTNYLKEEIDKNKNNFMNILKKIFYVLIKNSNFTKSSFYNLIMIKLINKIIIDINNELNNKKDYNSSKIEHVNNLRIDKSLIKINEIENLEYYDKVNIFQQEIV
jgi:hypothetical protein